MKEFAKKEFVIAIVSMTIGLVSFIAGSISNKWWPVEKDVEVLCARSNDILFEIKKMSENQFRANEYDEFLNQMRILFSREMKNNPSRMSGFFEEAINMAVQNSPGLAIEMERFASEQVKKEIEESRRELKTAQLQGEKLDKVGWLPVHLVNYSEKFDFFFLASSGSEQRINLVTKMHYAPIKLPPGKHRIECFPVTERGKYLDILVSREVRYLNDNKEVHGVVEIGRQH